MMLRRPSEMHEVEGWVYGPGGSLVSTGVTFLDKDSSFGEPRALTVFP